MLYRAFAFLACSCIAIRFVGALFQGVAGEENRVVVGSASEANINHWAKKAPVERSSYPSSHRYTDPAMHRPTDQPPQPFSDESHYQTTDSPTQRPTDPATHRYLERPTADQQVPGSNPGVPLLREHARNHSRPTYDTSGYAYIRISAEWRGHIFAI